MYEKTRIKSKRFEFAVQSSKLGPLRLNGGHRREIVSTGGIDFIYTILITPADTISLI